jgi:uncharacterized delta-60 repeat protein
MNRRKLSLNLIVGAVWMILTIFASQTAARENGKIAFVLNGSIWTMNADGSGRTQVANSGEYPKFSPDGTKIAFYGAGVGNGSIYLMNADGSNLRFLTTGSFYVDRKKITWSPDGSKIAFTCETYGRICTVNADGSNRTIINDNISDYAPDWSPDGSKIAFTRTFDGGLRNEIYVMNIDGSNQTRLTNNDLPDIKPVWSPDGTKLVFSRYYSCIVLSNGEVLCFSNSIYTMNAADGSNQTLLASGSALDDTYVGSPGWSPDGTKIIFWGDVLVGGQAFTDIFVINSTGGNRMNLTNTNNLSEYFPDWGNLPLTAGSLDPMFDMDGKATTPVGNFSNGVNSVALQADGKIVVAGYSYGTDPDFGLARLNADGSLDTSFGTNGKVLTDFGGSFDRAYAVALQADGKIVAAGETNAASGGFALVRYNMDGSLDTSFDGDGKVTTSFGGNTAAYSVAIQADGKIVVAGRGFDDTIGLGFALARYNNDGSLDASFGTDGKVTTDFSNGNDYALVVAIQSNGKIVAGGARNSYCIFIFPNTVCYADIALARYNAEGSLDNSFGTNGKVATVYGGYDRAIDVAIQADGKIVTAGGNSVVRYNTDGSLDTSFDADGRVIIPVANFVNAVAIQSNGKIVAAGINYIYLKKETTSDFALFRFNTNGSPDPSFDTDGIVTTDYGGFEDSARSIAIQPDGKIVAAGYARNSTDDEFAIARYIGDATRTKLDFDGDGKSDLSVFRPGNGVWYLNQSANGFSATQFGLSTDKIAPADYDGDGRTDIAVFRDGAWYLLRSQLGFTAIQFGQAGDVPVPADYDGDNRADVAVFRNGVWFILQSSNSNFRAVQFGIASDKAVPADFDGDGKTDVAVYRAGVWYWLRSSDGGFRVAQFGASDDKPVAGDYDGDGKTDLAVFRPGTGYWYILRSADNNFFAAPFGLATDILTPADYDGDGRADIAVYRGGAWYVLQSSNGNVSFRQFGSNGDTPTPAAFISQ